MEILIPNGGWIEAICGPMFSGKSEELIRRLRRARIARKRVQVFKPAYDDRYATEEIVSHANTRMRSEPVASANEILDKVNWRTEVIGIDESNFFSPELVDITNYLADNGKQVIVAGLDTDFMGRPFHPMPALLAVAESIAKTLAVCMRCGAPAKHSQRLVDSDELLLTGTAGTYEARCRRCFEPGIPRQASLNFPQTLAAADLLNGA
jgi:thymidine kinase